jgi:hypothetical protein
MIKVAINGYGTIGKRVADAVAIHKDLKVIGISKTRPNAEAFIAKQRVFPFYIADISKKAAFEKNGLIVAGSIEDKYKLADVFVDATPGDEGATNKPLYETLGKKALWLGGEDHEAARFSSFIYKGAIEWLFVRVKSCNTTGFCRKISIIGSRPQLHINQIQEPGFDGVGKDAGESKGGKGGGKKPIGYWISEILNKSIILITMFIAIKVIEIVADILWHDTPPFVKILIWVANAFLLVLLLFYIYETILDFFKKEP